MPLQKQTVSLPFLAGLNTKIDEKILSSPFLTELENGVLTKGGALTKRNGYTPLTVAIAQGGSLASGVRLANYKDELLLFDGAKLYSLASGTNRWSLRGNVDGIDVSVDRIIADNYFKDAVNSITDGTVEVYTFDDGRGTGTNYVARDAVTGTTYQSLKDLNTTGSQFHFELLNVTSSDSFFSIARRGDELVKISKANPTIISSPITIAADITGPSSSFNAVAREFSASTFIMLYRETSGTVKMRKINTTPSTLLSLLVPGAAATATQVDVVVNSVGSEFFAFWTEGTLDLYYAVFDSSFTTVLAKTLVKAGASGDFANARGIAVSGTTVRIYYQLGGSLDDEIRYTEVDNTGTVGSETTIAKRGQILSRPFSYGTKHYVVVGDLKGGGDTGETYVLMDDTGEFVSRQLPGLKSNDSFLSSRPFNVSTVSSGVFMWAGLRKTRLLSDGDDFGGGFGQLATLNGISRVGFDFNETTRFQSAQLGESLHIAGALMYDGVRVVEQGYHFRPHIDSATPAAGAGSMALGTYLYAVVYEWTDRNGQVHRSIPTDLEIVTLSGAENEVTLVITTLIMTQKPDVAIHVYRSTVGGSVLYKATSQVTPTFNDTTAQTVSITDGLADSSIIDNELLYTTGDVLANDPGLASPLLLSAKDRLFTAGVRNNELRYSKRHVDGDAVEFSDAFTIKFTDEGGDITALGAMDEKVIVFKKDRIFAFAGDGPNNIGQQDSFTEPQIVSSDVGCDNPLSVVLTNTGLMFQSDKGIYLLTRALQTQYIGAPVESFNDETITSAILVGDTNQVRFTTASDVALVYHYLANPGQDEEGVPAGQWSVFTNHEAESATVFGDNYIWLKDDGQAYEESPGFFLDDAEPYALKITTAWIKLAGLQGYKRVYRASLLGEFKSDHDLQIDIGYDYQQFFTDQLIWDAETALEVVAYGGATPYGEAIYGGNSDGVYQVRSHLPRQKVESIRFRIQDQDGGVSESYLLNDLSLEVGLKTGLKRQGLLKTV